MGMQWIIASAIYGLKVYDSVRKEILCNILIEFGFPQETGKANKNVPEWNL
jgi:hypothetical protein